MDFPRKLVKARAFALNGNQNSSLALYGKLVRHRPNNVDVWLEYAGVAVSAQRIDLAEMAWAKLEELHGNRSDVLQSLGFQYQADRRWEKARQCFTKVADLDPQHINSRINLALGYEKSHQFDQSRSRVEECLHINPKDDQARYLLAFLNVRSHRLELAESQLRDLIASDPVHEYVRYAARYKLAEVLDRTQRYDEAIELLKEAKDIVLVLADPKILEKQYDWFAKDKLDLARKLPNNTLQNWAASVPLKERQLTPRIAFIGGHPRSGTTLLEQIMAAHPEVAVIDEPQVLSWAVNSTFSPMHSYSGDTLNTIRNRYISMLLRQAEGYSQGKLLLEKNPSPTAALPILLKLFPELLVVIALRDPRDVILSCYFQNFPLNNVNANFLSFERLAKHYADLMDVWLQVREWSGLNWLETRYEDTVANLEKEGRRVTRFLGLDWNDNQSRFYNAAKQKQLTSPTYHDVTKPIYSDSVGRWRFYEKHMAAALPALDRFCRILGYS